MLFRKHGQFVYNFTYLRNKLPDASEFAASSVKNPSRELHEIRNIYSACHFKCKVKRRSNDNFYEGKYLYQLASFFGRWEGSVHICVNSGQNNLFTLLYTCTSIDCFVGQSGLESSGSRTLVELFEKLCPPFETKQCFLHVV